jgi:hypothetical protein
MDVVGAQAAGHDSTMICAVWTHTFTATPTPTGEWTPPSPTPTPTTTNTPTGEWTPLPTLAPTDTVRCYHTPTDTGTPTPTYTCVEFPICQGENKTCYPCEPFLMQNCDAWQARTWLGNEDEGGPIDSCMDPATNPRCVYQADIPCVRINMCYTSTKRYPNQVCMGGCYGGMEECALCKTVTELYGTFITPTPLNRCEIE